MPYRRYFQAYEDLMMSLQGRPHWAKVRTYCCTASCLVLGAWCLVLDAWCLVLGAWCLAECAQVFQCRATYLQLVYPKWNDFVRLQTRLDPRGILRNRWHDRVFHV